MNPARAYGAGRGRAEAVAQHRDGALGIRRITGAGPQREQEPGQEGHQLGHADVTADRAAALGGGQQGADRLPEPGGRAGARALGRLPQLLAALTAGQPG